MSLRLNLSAAWAGVCILGAASVVVDPCAASPLALQPGALPALSNAPGPLAAARHGRPAARPLFTSADVTPPVLNSISVSGAPNMTQSNPYVTVTLNISDDLSGFANGTVYLQSPSGDVLAQDIYEGANPLHVVHKEQMGYARGGGFGLEFNHWSQPGTWSISDVVLSDVAGNTSSYTGDALAALGKTTFVVSNARYDGIPPVLVSGQILTPTVSLSSGNDHGVPVVRAKVTMTDTGLDAAAGADYVVLYYCLPPVDVNNECADYLSTYTSLGVPSSGVGTTVTTSNIAYSWSETGAPLHLATPGVYQLAYVLFSTLDGISNASWSSTLVGGPDDLSVYFPSTTVTITP